MFRFLYSTFLHCVCCCCRIYAHSRRPKNRGKLVNAAGFEYVGTTSSDPSWPETDRTRNETKFYGTDIREQSEQIDDDIDDDINDVFYRMESRVPILVVISIIIGYICLGAIMFNYFEEWSMTNSVYFCYITLATVGFGDYVSHKCWRTTIDWLIWVRYLESLPVQQKVYDFLQHRSISSSVWLFLQCVSI